MSEENNFVVRDDLEKNEGGLASGGRAFDESMNGRHRLNC